MARQRRVSYAGIGAVVLALAMAAPALAAPGSAELVATGPLQLDGRSAVVAESGYLLVQDPGSEAFEGLTFGLQAAQATVIVHELRMSCWQATPRGLVRVAMVDGLPERLGLSRLDGAAETAAGTLDGIADTLTTTQGGLVPAPLAAAAAKALDVVAPDFHRASADDAAGPVPPLPVPLPGEVACLNTPEDVIAESFEVAQLTLATELAKAAYGGFFRGGSWDDEGAKGTALLQASALGGAYVPREETVRFLDAADPWGQHDVLAASETLPAESVRSTASSATGTFFGTGTLWLYNIDVLLGGVQGSNPAWTHRAQTGPEGSGDGRVVRYLEVQMREGSGSFVSPGEVLVQGDHLAMNVDGTLSIAGATGEARIGDQVFEFEDEATALTGQLAFDVIPVDHHARDSEGALRLRGQGEVTSIQGAGPIAEPQQQQSTVTTAAAAVSVAAVAAGLAAWFWPALKWLVAPLYTRIPKDTLLMHDARERIFKLIREEPGIHAHEVAARLDLGWGTAVYHLKLLERNGLVVSRHEGRYKRFFVTGDQRIQVKDAVALLRNPTSRSIAAQVARQPGLIQKQVCEALGLSPSLASWHLQRLEAAQVVRAERLGRAVRYIPGQAWLDLQELDAALKPAVPATALPAQAPPQPPTLPGAA